MFKMLFFLESQFVLMASEDGEWGNEEESNDFGDSGELSQVS